MTQMTRAMAVAGVLILAASQAAVAQEDLLGRWFLNVNFGLQAPGRKLPEVGSLPLYDEALTIDGTRQVGSAPFVDAGAGIHVSESFALGLAYSRFSKKSDVVITARVPHPLFVNRPRSAAAVLDNLRRTEDAIHVVAMWRFLLLEGVDFKIGLGPSFFRVTETGPVGVTATEAGPPFENVTLAFATGTRRRSGVGGNITGDLTYMITERLGAGMLLRYSAATIKVPMPGGQTRGKNGVGGLQFGLGGRLRF